MYENACNLEDFMHKMEYEIDQDTLKVVKVTPIYRILIRKIYVTYPIPFMHLEGMRYFLKPQI